MDWDTKLDHLWSLGAAEYPLPNLIQIKYCIHSTITAHVEISRSTHMTVVLIIVGHQDFSFYHFTRTVLWPTQLPMQCTMKPLSIKVNWQEHEGDHLPPFNIKV
jgi:hypothetical protein